MEKINKYFSYSAIVLLVFMNFACAETKDYSVERQIQREQPTASDPKTNNDNVEKHVEEPSPRETEIHDFLDSEFNKLEQSYRGTSQVPSEEEELKVVDKVAKKFGLTRQQVLDIWNKIEMP